MTKMKAEKLVRKVVDKVAKQASAPGGAVRKAAAKRYPDMTAAKAAAKKGADEIAKTIDKVARRVADESTMPKVRRRKVTGMTDPSRVSQKHPNMQQVKKGQEPRAPKPAAVDEAAEAKMDAELQHSMKIGEARKLLEENGYATIKRPSRAPIPGIVHAMESGPINHGEAAELFRKGAEDAEKIILRDVKGTQDCLEQIIASHIEALQDSTGRKVENLVLEMHSYDDNGRYMGYGYRAGGNLRPHVTAVLGNGKTNAEGDLVGIPVVAWAHAQLHRGEDGAIHLREARR